MSLVKRLRVYRRKLGREIQRGAPGELRGWIADVLAAGTEIHQDDDAPPSSRMTFCAFTSRCRRPARCTPTALGRGRARSPWPLVH